MIYRLHDCQVLKAFTKDTAFDDQDREQLGEVQATWNSEASAFLFRNEAGKAKGTRDKRLTSHEMCCAIDNIWVVMTGTGCKQFKSASYLPRIEACRSEAGQPYF